MSTKQDLEEIRHRAQRECNNIRTSMLSRGCSEEEIESKCREIVECANKRVSGLIERTRIKN